MGLLQVAGAEWHARLVADLEELRQFLAPALDQLPFLLWTRISGWIWQDHTLLSGSNISSGCKPKRLNGMKPRTRWVFTRGARMSVMKVMPQ